jgi:tyrosyl-tRNA synthetase
MSKSYGNYVGIDEPPAEIFGKLMSISDDLMWRYFELLSTRTLEEIVALRQAVADGGKHPKEVKEDLAFEMTALYHGDDKAREARREFNAVFAEGGAPQDAPRYACRQGEDSSPVAFLTAAGLTASRGAARRLIAQNALTVDGLLCTDGATPLAPGAYVVKLGKKRFLRLCVE